MPHDAKELHALNDQILAVRQLVPAVDLGFSARQETMALQLESINRTCFQEEAEQLPFDARTVLTPDTGECPPKYTRLIDTGAKCQRLAEPLERLTELTTGLDGLRNHVVVALIYPLLLCVLAGIVLGYICQVTIPELQATYVALDAPVGFGTIVMERMRAWMPVWLIGAALIVCAVWYLVAWSGRTWQTRPSSVALSSQFGLDLLASETAELASTLVQAGTPAEQSIRLAQETLVRPTTESIRMPDTAARPFMKWTLEPSNAIDRAELLQTAASLYHEMASRRGESYGRMLPLLLSVVIGGAVTLGVGLALFIPFSQFMHAVASLVESI